MKKRPKRRVRKTGLAEEIYDRLRRGIVTLRLAPGTPLVETEICARLGVSRTPVRAALERLHQEGLATLTGTRTRGRAVVAALTEEDMRELFLLVGALDGMAARLAASLDRGSRVQLAARLRSINEQLGALEDVPADIPRAQALDHEFHRTYEVAAAGPRLIAKLETLHAQRERYVRLYTQALLHAHSLEESLAEHRAIADAIEAGDADAADRAAAFNHRNALERYARGTERA